MFYTSPTKLDIESVARNMREADVREIRVGTGRGPLEVLRESVEASSWCMAAIYRGVPVAIYGVCPLGDEVGQPWMLGTTKMEEFPRRLIVDGRLVVTRMHRDYKLLVNWVHCENTRSILWLRHLGFTVKEEGLFYQFYRRRDDRPEDNNLRAA